MLAPLTSIPRAGGLPSGYSSVDAHRSRHADWVQLLDSSGDFGRIDRGTLRREILSIMIPNGGVLIENGGSIVACATAAYAARFSPHALLNYVLVDRRHRGKGLGRIASAEAMQRAANAGYQGMILQTDDERDRAIAMYLSLGFEPVLDSSPDADIRWQRIRERLGEGS